MQLRATTPLGWVIRIFVGLVGLGLVGACLLIGLIMVLGQFVSFGP